MLKVLGCFATAHDHRLVALAALVCALASVTAVQLLCHARRVAGRPRALWLGVAAMAGGSGIWATHFIAMLAFAPGLPAGYDLGLTGLSLVYAVALSGAGLSLALQSARLPGAPWLGGALMGGGIAAMHYTGMAAYEVGGRLVWDPWLVGASIALGAGLGSAALAVALGGSGARRQAAGAVLLLLAIVSHHFTAMGAVTIVPDPRLTVSVSAVPASWLAIAVALASLAVLLFAGAALAVDLRERRHAEQEGARLRSLANAAVEGLLVCRDGRIVSANASFATLAGTTQAALDGTELTTFLPAHSLSLALAAGGETPVEAELQPLEGAPIPVELIMRPIAYAAEPHHAVAVRDLRARRRAERQIQFLALHDGLTGLANRASFARRLEQEMAATAARRGRLAVLCLDLDRFKEVNDLFGHAAGDALLQDMARIAGGVLGEDQMMARLGGDEFAVLAPVEHAVQAGRLAERLLEALRQESAGRVGPQIATSIGIAVFPDDADERALLLTYADTALYRAKSEGRGTYRFFEERMGVEVRERRVLEHELRHAVARGEMSMVYQPQTRIEGGEVTGFEALLRWQHPSRGAVSPAVFVPVAEETGLILPIGEWVLRQTCREAARWASPLTIAVNVSAVQLHAAHFAQTLHEILFQTGLPAERLEIEITETALVRDPARALATLRQIKALGVRIAMDDFGTGYSSLSNLRLFPFDKLKIDGSFIRQVDSNEQAAAIVRSVLGLGRGLGLPVLAEGVETGRELEFLARENCHEVQGYLLGRPAPIEQFAALTGVGPSGSPEAAEPPQDAAAA